MTNRRKKPDVVKVLGTEHGWSWVRYICDKVILGPLFKHKVDSERDARELNPGCTFEIEESK